MTFYACIRCGHEPATHHDQLGKTCNVTGCWCEGYRVDERPSPGFRTVSVPDGLGGISVLFTPTRTVR